MNIKIAVTTLLVIAAPAVAQPERGNRPNIQEILRDLDENNDFRIERSEVPEKGIPAFETLLKHGDANKDGVLGMDEVRGIFLQMARNAGPELSADAIRAMDKDGDGVVAREEFTGPEPFFGVLDTNRDGDIAKEEIDRMERAGKRIAESDRPGMDGGMLAKRIEGFDTDKDGVVTKAEFQGAEALFTRLDRDSDGKLTAEERKALSSMREPGQVGDAMRKMAGRMREMDKNADGKIDKDEFTGPAQLFERLDVNKDGFISPDDRALGGDRPEMKKAFEFLRKKKADNESSTKPTN